MTLYQNSKMTICRTNFFLILVSLVIIPILSHKIVWLAGSEKTNGTMSFVGKTYAGQMVYTYSVVWFMAGKDTVWFNGRNEIIFREGEKVPVRYQKKNPADAKLNVFLGIWGDTAIYGGIPVLILLVIFLHPLIIPYRSRILLKTTKPFVMIV